MKKKVLFVMNTMGCGGAEAALLNLLSKFSPDAFDVSLYVLLDQGELIERLPTHVHLLNQQFYPVSVLDKQGEVLLKKTVMKKFFHHGAVWKRLPYMFVEGIRMIRRGRIALPQLLWQVVSDGSDRFNDDFDLAVAYLEGGATYYVANHVHAKRKAAFIHVDYSRAGYTPSLDDGCYSKFERIFAVSEEVKQSFADIYHDHTPYVLHNLLNVEEIIERSKEPVAFDPGFDGYKLLTIGRLVPQKAFDVSIDAMHLLKQNGVRARWYVLGEGSDRQQLEDQCKRLGLEEDFRFLGTSTNPYPYLREADLYVHASRFEGKSIAVQEAQILGKPILVSDCSGNREQVQDGIDGELCELNASDLSQHIQQMLCDPNRCRQYGQAARQRIGKNEQAITKLMELVS